MFNILIPNYNNAIYLGECLNSILSQVTNFTFHIYINDDCSTDNSIEIINEYIIKYPDKISLLQNSKNLSLLSTICKLYELLNIDDYFTVLDPDDYWIDNSFLQRAYDYFNNNPEYSVYSETANIMDNNTKETLGIMCHHTSATAYKGQFNKNILSTIKNIAIYKDINLTTRIRDNLYQGDNFRNLYFSLQGKVYIDKKYISGVYRINHSNTQLWNSLKNDIQNLLNNCINIEMNVLFNINLPVNLDNIINIGNMETLFYRNKNYNKEDINNAIDYFINKHNTYIQSKI